MSSRGTAMPSAQQSRPVTPRPDVTTRRRSRFSGATGTGAWAWLFVTPLLLGAAVFYHYPILKNTYVSFTQSGAFGGNQHWVGLQNYSDLFSSPDLPSALVNTLIYTAIVLLAIPLSIGIAAMIEQPGLRFKSLYRVMFFMPYLAMPIAIAQVWRLVFNGSFGLVNQALRALGVDNPPFWLSTPGYALTAVAIFGVWGSIGFNVIILSAGLKGIPKELYEAASIDGASNWRQFKSITVPLLSPSIFFLMIMQTIGGFQLFDALFAMIGPSNPAMPQTRSLVFLFYNDAFILNDKGAGAAIAMVILALVAVVTVLQFLGQRKWVNYV